MNLADDARKDATSSFNRLTIKIEANESGN